MKPKKNYSAPALEKGLDIIELLSSSILGYSQAEIAKELNRSVNEIYRMLTILVSRNYIELDEDTERYKLTFKLLQLSSKHQPIKNLYKLIKKIDKLFLYYSDRLINVQDRMNNVQERMSNGIKPITHARIHMTIGCTTFRIG